MGGKSMTGKTLRTCTVGTIPTDSNEAHLSTLRYDQRLAHAHNHITRAVAAMGSCFALVRLFSIA